MHKATKTCSRCQQRKSVAQFREDKKSPDRLWYFCQECESNRKKEYRKANVDRLRASGAAYRAEHADAVRLTNKRYRDAHKERRRASCRIYAVEHAASIRRRMQTWRAAHAAALRLYMKTYAETNRLRLRWYRELNAERIKKHAAAYARAHLERGRERSRKHQALKSGSGHSPYRELDIFERDGWACQLCGRRINRRLRHPHRLSKTIDHIVPLSKGGFDCPKNVQAAHFGCNSGKQARLIGQLRLLD